MTVVWRLQLHNHHHQHQQHHHHQRHQQEQHDTQSSHTHTVKHLGQRTFTCPLISFFSPSSLSLSPPRSWTIFHFALHRRLFRRRPANNNVRCAATRSKSLLIAHFVCSFAVPFIHHSFCQLIDWMRLSAFLSLNASFGGGLLLITTLVEGIHRQA